MFLQRKLNNAILAFILALGASLIAPLRSFASTQVIIGSFSSFDTRPSVSSLTLSNHTSSSSLSLSGYSSSYLAFDTTLTYNETTGEHVGGIDGSVIVDSSLNRTYFDNVSISGFKTSNSGVQLEFDIPYQISVNGGNFSYVGYFTKSDGTLLNPLPDYVYAQRALFPLVPSYSVSSGGYATFYSYIDFDGNRYHGDNAGYVFFSFQNSLVQTYSSGVHCSIYIPPDGTCTLTFHSRTGGLYRLYQSTGDILQDSLNNLQNQSDANLAFAGDSSSTGSAVSAYDTAESALIDSSFSNVNDFTFTDIGSLGSGFASSMAWVSTFMQNLYINSPYAPAFNIMGSIGLASIAIGLVRMWRGS